MPITTALLAATGACIINQDAPHLASRDRKKMCSVLPVDQHVDQFPDPRQPRLALGRDALDAEHLDAVGAPEVVERVVRRHQDATVLRNRPQRIDAILMQLSKPAAVGLCIGPVLLGMRRIELRERLRDHVHVTLAVAEDDAVGELLALRRDQRAAQESAGSIVP